MTKREKILERALEMAIGRTECTCYDCDPTKQYCLEHEGKTCTEVHKQYFIRKAKSQLERKK